MTSVPVNVGTVFNSAITTRPAGNCKFPAITALFDFLQRTAFTASPTSPSLLPQNNSLPYCHWHRVSFLSQTFVRIPVWWARY
jgi:hypothetical protein